MMYILTQEEYVELKQAKSEKIQMSKKKLQTLCTKIANEMPVNWGWGGPDPKPWGCIHTENDEYDEWYCDKCPVQEICPEEWKNWSK